MSRLRCCATQSIAPSLYHFASRTEGPRHQILPRGVGIEEFYRHASDHDPTYFRTPSAAAYAGRAMRADRLNSSVPAMSGLVSLAAFVRGMGQAFG